MLIEPKLGKQSESWQAQGATDRTEARPTPELLAYQRQILRALAQGASWIGGRLPLSFQPSPYRVRVKESNFFATSALECLQLPVLFDERIEVETLCPSTGSAIHLTITDQGVMRQEPLECVMSVAVTGRSAANGSYGQPARAVDLPNLARQLTRFFSSAEAAALWLVAYPDAQILQLDQAWRLATDLATQRRQPDRPTAIIFID